MHNGNPHALRVSNGNLLYVLAYYYKDSAPGISGGFYCNLGAEGSGSKYTQVCKALGGVASSECYTGSECFKLP